MIWNRFWNRCSTRTPTAISLRSCSRALRPREIRRVNVASMVSLGFALFVVGAACNAGEPVPSESHGMSVDLPIWLQGVWSRDWIEKRGVKSNTLDVHYLQTPTFFADMRIPRDRSGVVAAKSFADVTDEQLRSLARQNGFTGRTTMAGIVATWQHDIDFQPSDGTPDKGRLERVPPDQMYEHGIDGSYIEAWRSSTDGKGRFLVVRVEHSGRLLRTLVVVGDQFVYVRNRVKDLPIASSFDALVEATHPSREQMEAYLDCEFSTGRVRGGRVPWEIEQSTLPWREGHHLDFVEQVSPRAGGSGLMPREAGEDVWTVPVNTMSPREIEGLFGEGLRNPKAEQ
jgi:hypothetical protein